MPAQINPTLLLDYYSPAGMKVWAMTTEELVSKFDCNEGLLYFFVEEVRRRAEMEYRDLYVQGIPIGAALFKVLMSKTVVDMVVTTSKYRINLQNLDTYM
eukprot:10355100-Ditylum_brightwellii.AAC.1